MKSKAFLQNAHFHCSSHMQEPAEGLWTPGDDGFPGPRVSLCSRCCEVVLLFPFSFRLHGVPRVIGPRMLPSGCTVSSVGMRLQWSPLPCAGPYDDEHRDGSSFVGRTPYVCRSAFRVLNGSTGRGLAMLGGCEMTVFPQWSISVRRGHKIQADLSLDVT